jgi:hypothetical protein
MIELDAQRLFGTVAVVSFGGLCLLVAVAGAVGLWAEFSSNWRSFFVMERNLDLIRIFTQGLLAVFLVAVAGLIASID